MSDSGKQARPATEAPAAASEVPQQQVPTPMKAERQGALRQIHRSLKAWRSETADEELAERAEEPQAEGDTEGAKEEDPSAEGEADAEPEQVATKRDDGAPMKASVLRQVLRKSAHGLTSAVSRKVFRAKPGGKGDSAALTAGHVAKKPPGLKKGERSGGHAFGNKEKRLPEKDAAGKAITYTEYDVNKYDGVNRDAERVVVGSDGRHWYTGDHYGSFTEVK